MKGKDTTFMAYLLEEKSEGQKVCFTFACLMTFFSLFPKLLERNAFSYPLAITVFIIFFYYLFVAKD